VSTRYRPDLVTDELIALTRRLGALENDLVILAEGNTSELMGNDIVVKASGSSMREAGISTFVASDIASLTTLLDDPQTNQDALTAALDAGSTEVGPLRASIEALVHVAVRSIAPVRFVAHTHPTAVVSLLASVRAESAFDEPVYSEELMVLGRPLFVPYAEPGLGLGRQFVVKLREYATTYGELPSLVLLGNHGIVAISHTAEGIEAISAMAVKSARVRLGALQAGGMVTLDQETTGDYFRREDFASRRSSLAGVSRAGGNA